MACRVAAPDRLKLQPSLTARLIARLTDEIEGGAVAPGERLATESAMMARFGVSRTVVREAVAALRAAGLVTSHQGRGVFVAKRSGNGGFALAAQDLASLGDILQVMELRLAVEVEMAALAALNRHERHLAAMQAELLRIDRAIARDDDAVEPDFAFHLAIAKATGNPYFHRLLDFLGTLLIPRRRVRLAADEPARRRLYLIGVQEEHRRIHDAIARRAADEAREAARRHIENSRERYRLARDAARTAGVAD